MHLDVTDKACERMRELMSSQGDVIALRFCVRLSGCKGFSYHIELANERLESDEEILVRDDLRVFVDRDTGFLLDGTQVDYINSAMSSGFVFSNPNASSQCGCGKSFSHAHRKGDESGGCC